MAACALLGGTPPPAAAAASQGTAPNLTHRQRLPGRAGEPDRRPLLRVIPRLPPTSGLTIDGALALAATGDDDAALRKIVAFLDDDGKDPSGDTVNEWTGIGTSNASGGAIGKEALLAEVVGDNPRQFRRPQPDRRAGRLGLHPAHSGGNTSCAAAGSYLNATSVFDQALGIMAQLRAGQASEAAAPVAYLESLQNANGSFPSLIPPSGGPDVDSTAMAVMALALAPGAAGRGRRRGRPRLDRQPAGAQRRFPQRGRGIDQLDRAGHPGPDAAGRRLPGPHQRGAGVPGQPAEQQRRVQRRRGPARL